VRGNRKSWSYGEISRARVAPADRAGVRKFLARFKGQGLEVALEATTGWRFLVEELQRIGAEVHLAELGDTRRFENSRDAVRFSGLDITVYQSDQRRAAGHLSRHGPPALRWALYEAAQAARRPSSPDRVYYEQLAARVGGNRACIAISRKLLKRSDGP
jgi:transposase